MKNTRALIKRSCFIAFFAVIVSCGESRTGYWSDGSDAGNEITESMKNEQLTQPEYTDWIESGKSGLTISKSIDDVKYSIQYKPLQYEALIRLGNNAVSNDRIDSMINELSDMQYYTFKVSTTDHSGEALKYKLPDTDEYYRRIEYCSFRMQDDISLVDNKDTLPCRLFHFERIFGVAPEVTFVLAFEDKRSKEDKQAGKYAGEKIFSFNDGIFGMGKINLLIREPHLNNIPQLTIALNN